MIIPTTEPLQEQTVGAKPPAYMSDPIFALITGWVRHPVRKAWLIWGVDWFG